MFKFLIGLILGVIAGAVAVLIFTAMGSTGNPFTTPALMPGQAVVHISVDEAYLNQQLTAVMATQPGFTDANPKLDLREPNVAALTASIEANVGGNTVQARPTVMLQFGAENNRVRVKVTGVNLGAMNIPRALIQSQLDTLERTVEDQANRAITNGLSGTGLKVIAVSASATSMLVDLGQ
jgi:hypothetical protein